MADSRLYWGSPRLWGWLTLSVLLSVAVWLLPMGGADVRHDVTVEMPDSVASESFPSDSIDINNIGVWPLRQVGFSSYQVARILELRLAGFEFRSVADLWAVPHMDSSLVASIGSQLVFRESHGRCDEGAPRMSWASRYRSGYRSGFESRVARVPLFLLDSVLFAAHGGSSEAWDTFALVARSYVLRGSARPDSLAMLSASALGSFLRAHGRERQQFEPVARHVEEAFAPVGVNSADEAALVAVPGIGLRSAAAIIEYRDRLGGFVSLEQLREVWAVADRYDEVVCHLLLDTVALRRINVNSSNDTRMRRHPYFTRELCRRVASFRMSRRGGRLTPSDLHAQADSLGLNPLFWHYVEY